MPSVVYSLAKLKEISKNESKTGIGLTLIAMAVLEGWLSEREYQYKQIMHDFAVESDAIAVEMKLRFG